MDRLLVATGHTSNTEALDLTSVGIALDEAAQGQGTVVGVAHLPAWAIQAKQTVDDLPSMPYYHLLKVILHTPTPMAFERARNNATNLKREAPEADVHIRCQRTGCRLSLGRGA